MSVDFTAFDAQLTGTNGAAGSAGGTIDGGDGGNAIESLPPFSNTDFSPEPSLNRVFPTATAGNGGAGAGGANATATTLALQGGQGGKGGAAFITMDHDIFGSAATPHIGFVEITMSVDAATIGSAGGGSAGVGGAGGRGGLGITVVTGVNGSQDSRGSDGAIGGAGGIGEVANADLTAMTSYATSDLQIWLISNGGKGGQGGFGGSGGNGSLSAGNGADGAPAGAGAPAEATFSGATAFNDSAIFVTEQPTGGFGGSGGNGGNGGNLGPAGSPPMGFGANGNGGAGGAGGGASATVSGDTLTAPSVQFTLNADGSQGGKGGLGGNAGPAPGLNGAAGSDGAGSITFTNNVITVGSGIPGDTQLSGSDLLLLNLRVATIGPAGFFLPGVLDGAVGGNLAFSGNTFIGDGASRLVLQLGSTGTAVVDTIANTISIDGSPTSNTISGFTTFDLDTNDTFVAGGGSYRVTFAPDPDTLVMTPTSGNVTLSGITATNFLLDFRGFNPSFDAAALAADINTSTGSTVITLSPTSTITLQGYTGGIASGAVIFEPTVVGPSLSGSVALKSATEGTALAATTPVATFTDSNTGDVASGFTATITWGDGTTAAGTVTGSNGSFAVDGGHTYADEGSLPVGVTVTRTADNSQLVLNGTVAVGEADVLTGHGLTLAANPNQSFSGTVATFTDSYTGAAAAGLVALINWGDGSVATAGTVTGSNGSFSVSGTHTYTTAGHDTVTVTLSDATPGTASATATSTVNVGASLSGSVALTSATEGTALAVTTPVATFTDSNTGDVASGFTATITWGDGMTSAGTVTGSNGSFAVDGGHTYADEGSLPVGVTVTRTADSSQLVLNGTVAVAEADVLTGLGLTLAANPNQSFSGTVATFTDSYTGAAAAGLVALINWGDGSVATAGTVIGSNGSFSVSGTHTYTTAGHDTVTVTLSDATPGTASATATSTVNVGASLSGSVALTSATEGTALAATTPVATFTDSNTGDVASGFTATITWGDGTTAAGTVTGSNGSFAVDGGHTYADEGSLPVGVTVTRTADSSQLVLNGTVAVAEADMLTGHGLTLAANPNQSFSGTVATFTDSYTGAAAAGLVALINWGDGSVATAGTVIGSNGSFSVSGTHTYTTAGHDTVTVTLSDATPGTASATATSTVNVGASQPPIITSDGGGDTATILLFENETIKSEPKHYVTTVAATDASGKSLTYAIIGGADQKLFQIDPKTGVLVFKSAPDDDSLDYQVKVGAFDGSPNNPSSLSDVQSLTVKVSDLQMNGSPSEHNTFVLGHRDQLTHVNLASDTFEFDKSMFTSAANAPHNVGHGVGFDLLTHINLASDTFEFDKSMFTSAANVLQHAADLTIFGHHEVVITYDAPKGQPIEHDIFILDNITKAQLQSHLSDFHFV